MRCGPGLRTPAATVMLLAALLIGCTSPAGPRSPVPVTGGADACPFQRRAAELADDAGLAAARGPDDSDADRNWLPGFAAQYTQVTPVLDDRGQPLLYQAIRGGCQWLLDTSGQPLQLPPGLGILTDATPLPTTGEPDGFILRLGLAPDGEAASDASGSRNFARLLRVADGQTFLSPPIALHERPAPNSGPLYAADSRGIVASPPDLMRAQPGRMRVVHDPRHHAGVLDLARMQYVVLPDFAMIRGYASQPDAAPTLWAALTPADDDRHAQISLFAAEGQRLHPELEIGAVEAEFHARVVALRIHSAELPTPAPLPPYAGAGDPLVAGIQAQIQRDAADRNTRGNACLYLDSADGALLERTPARVASGQPCPVAHSGLLPMTFAADRFALYRFNDAGNTRLPVSDLSGELVAFQERELDARGRQGLVIIATADDAGRRYTIHDFEGRQLHAQSFDDFVDVGCGHWRVHDGARDRWLGITVDGRLSPRLTVPFSC